MKKLEKYCKNCGANINDETQICPDCGKPIPTKHNYKSKQCPYCGQRLIGYEQFCRNCGRSLKNPPEEKTSTTSKNRTPIIIVAVILVIAVVVFGAFSSLIPIGSQDVQVDTFSFKIPNNFVQDEDLTFDETEDGVKYLSKYWENDDDEIQIDVTYSASGNVNANDVAKKMGGDKENMMGYDGYYNELMDAYSFTFVKDNKVISVYTSNYDLLNQIEVL